MTLPASSLSSSAEDAINRTIESTNVFGPVSSDDIDHVYEIPKCSKWINDEHFQIVALQFPVELAVDTVEVIRHLEKNITAELFFLGDTSHGSCCVDEVQAQKLQADAIIHFGPACLSPTTRLPVLYVFGRRPLDLEDCAAKFRELFPNPETQVVLMYDTVYSHAADDIYKALHATYPSLLLSELIYPDKPVLSQQKVEKKFCDGEYGSVCCGGPCQKHPLSDENCLKEDTGREPRNVPASNRPLLSNRRVPLLPQDKPVEEFCVFYVGAESRTLINLMLTWNHCPFYTYNPVTKLARPETLNVNKMLRKRFFKIEQAKDAEVVGVVIGTLAVKGYREMVQQMQELIVKSGKRCYIFEVGQLTPAKLANYSAPEVFVMLTCPENVVLDSGDFFRPLLTPFELELACNPERSWTGAYVTDFTQLLPGSANFVDLPNTNYEALPDVSLITNKLRVMGDQTENNTSGNLTVAVRSTMALAASGQQLTKQSWHGLDPRLGETPVEKVKEGRRGIAVSYDNEPNVR